MIRRPLLRGFARMMNSHLRRHSARIGPMLFWVAVVACLPLPRGQGAEPIRVMTFNIRYNNPNDGVNAWPNRKDFVAKMIERHAPDVVGLQEALIGQLRDLDEQLEGYDRCGVGRDDGVEAGEFAAILYRSDRLRLGDHGTFWFSDTPDEASAGWDDNRRVVTWAHFRDKTATGSSGEFSFFNAHFGFTKEFREKAPPLLRSRIAEFAAERPFVVVGDFNMSPSSSQFEKVTRGDGAAGDSLVLRDAYKVSTADHEGPESTFHGFRDELAPGGRIDYIFVGPHIDVVRHAILPDRFEGRPPSDHLPVIAELVMDTASKSTETHSKNR